MNSFKLWTILTSITLFLSVITFVLGVHQKLIYPHDCNYNAFTDLARACGCTINQKETDLENKFVTIKPKPILENYGKADCTTMKAAVERRCIYSNVHYDGNCEGQEMEKYIFNCGLVLSKKHDLIKEPSKIVIPNEVAESSKKEPYNCFKNLMALNFLCREDHTYYE